MHTFQPQRAAQFILLYLVVIGLASTRLPAQTPRENSEPPPTLEVAACVLFEARMPKFFYQDSNGVYQPFEFRRQKRDGYMTVPLAPTLQLFRRTKDEEGNWVWNPAMALPLQPESPRNLFLFYKSPDGKTQNHLLTDLPGDHPARTVRTLNLMNREVAVLLNGDRFRLGPGEEKLVEMPENEKRPFLFAYERAQDGGEGLFKSAQADLRLRDEWRLLIVFTNSIRTEEGDDGRSRSSIAPASFRLYDRAPADTDASAN